MISPIHQWRTTNQRLLLEGRRCLSCQKIWYPVVTVCCCGARSFEPCRLSGKGVIQSWTVVTSAFGALEQQVPFYLGLIALDEGVSLVAQLTEIDPVGLAIGMPVRATIRRYAADGAQGIIHYGIKFAPSTVRTEPVEVIERIKSSV